ncbi:putative vacuolar protein sorting-associated protein TDA6 [Echria macrotheca]|uniref:Vacuolar protein sorting-associated protein TDA6 n=1 Tax=Echria macrotheca TaxID=438768 RepID=A0AAJ0FAV8_9PEZI|nr:putative vacuolar protein sorting-associated protein TDA6 [Echria macrotheca]
MVYHIRRLTIAASALAALVFLVWLLPRILNPTPPDDFERRRDQQWVESSPYWIDRQLCRWLSLCGIQHLRWDAPAISDAPPDGGDLRFEILKALALGWSAERTFVTKKYTSSWEEPPMQSDLKRKRLGAQGTGRILEKVPDYVLEHAPLVHLYSKENFWPSTMMEHIRHMEPFEDGASLNWTAALNLDNLGDLNKEEDIVFLTSTEDVENRPEWLHSRVGIPVPFSDDDFEEDDGAEHKHPEVPDDSTWWDADRTHPPHRIVDPSKRPAKERRPHQRRLYDEGQRPLGGDVPVDEKKTNPPGYSEGPAVLILVDKGAGIVDAFWFFFYSYNLGQTVLNIRFGNHVGDWEHCMIRFEHGVPRAMFLSEHAGGKAYAWKAMEKKRLKGSEAERPVIYSAVGSHAMYALPGLHPYVLPFKMLKDVTDKGPLWDPARNHLAFWYDYELGLEEDANPTNETRKSLEPAASNPDLPTSWFYYEGFWGDDIYPLSDRRQWRLFGEYHYVVGPLGPKFKFLERRKVCQTDKCIIVESIEAGEKSAWY